MKALTKELGIQSNKLDQEVKERVERAVEALGCRVTVGDVAARAGVKLSEADEALQALCYDSLGALEVSEEGQVVYVLPRDFRSRIRTRSWLQRAAPLAKRATGVFSWLARAAFGTALIASVALVWVAIAALTSSRDSDRRDRGGYGGGMRGGIWIDPTDLFLFWDPYYGRHTQERLEQGGGMSFVEAIFSWVFGDGDPNMRFEEKRWRALGQHIQRLGGVVSAEEMAPFLDPPLLGRRRRSGGAKYEDESFVLPALLRFGGEAFVDEAGHLLYRFPELQVSGADGGGAARRGGEARVPLERDWEFSAASPGQQAGSLLLGVANVVGVLVLSTLLADPVAKLALYRQGLGFIMGLLPALQAYAGAFFAIPLLRMFVYGQRNTEINSRNEARLQAVELLQADDAEVAAKAAAARKLGRRRVLGAQDVVYTTERAVDEQVNTQQEREFDRRLRGGGAGGAGAGAGRRFDDVFDRRRGGGEPPAREPRAGGGRRRDDDWDRLDRW